MSPIKKANVRDNFSHIFIVQTTVKINLLKTKCMKMSPTAEVSVSSSLYKTGTHFRVGYRECVHPHTPPSPFVLDGMVEQNAKDVVNHLSDLLLIRVFGVDVAKRKHPVLPHRALKQTPAIHITTQSTNQICLT